MQIVIEACESIDHPGWLGLRDALWPDDRREEHLDERAGFRETERVVYFVKRID